jgi:putative membrane protein
MEKAAVGKSRLIYYILLGTHIPLAGSFFLLFFLLPIVLLSVNSRRHKKLARITWPIWFYVAVTGVLVYWMISPYYS